jgi:glucosamine--fructose-6-phosphate aminotransferase (isomerizing)
MCGIFSYYGPKTDAQKIALEGLKKLEYRGYDSWGIAYKNNATNEINIYKKIGKISEVPEDVLGNAKSSLAIGHSRWATHGGVKECNAHPHESSDGSLAIVHNGIFENYAEHKKILQKKGYKFKSETDTEVAAFLIEENIKQGEDLLHAVTTTLKTLTGRYAILVLNKDTNALIAARRGSPLIIGVGQNEHEYFIASDIPAFLKYTNKVLYLDDNQMVYLNGGIKFFEIDTLNEIEKRIIEVNIKEEEAEKGQYAHFMIKEIMDQKDTILRAINQDDNEVQKIADIMKEAVGTYLVGCGTAGKVCLAAEYIFAKVAKKHINFAIGSEFEGFKNFIKKGSHVIAISQSGETADTLEALEIAKKQGATLISIVNVESSTMARMTDYTLPINAGPEKAVASTKATTSQLAIIILLAHALVNMLDAGKHFLINTAAKINDMLNPRYEEHILNIAKKIQNVESMYIIGKGVNYPMALESAIKLQEVSYIHAEGFAGGELKHGPLALMTKGTPVIALCAKDEHFEHIIANANEAKTRGGTIIGISPENNPVFDYWIKVPEADIDSAIINIIPIQILAYHLAVLKNNDPDKPRNLAKSVTVK